MSIDTVKKTKETQRVTEPPMFAVLVLNDNTTPFEYVVASIMNFFDKTSNEAIEIMKVAHTSGKALCGVFTKDYAETKATTATNHAKQYGLELQYVIEPESSKDNKEDV